MGSVENTLGRLLLEADNDPERKRQLAAIRYYINLLISRLDQEWFSESLGITNYLTLLDQLRRQKQEVLLVTFNYDRLIERALRGLGIAIEDLSHYVQDATFKLFKLHGSVHWGREVEITIADVKEKSVWDIGTELIQNAAELKISDRFHIVDSQPIGKYAEIPLIPAIAIPVVTKTTFECPPEHIEYLRANLGRATKALIVGWRATEEHFLSLWRDNSGDKIKLSWAISEKEMRF